MDRIKSPCSQFENQLRLDLIDEEENIDEMLNGTQNQWIKDVQRNEGKYDRQEVISLEQEKVDLMAQCAKLEHDISFMNNLQKVGKQFNQTGKSAVQHNNNPARLMNEKRFSNK